MQTVEETSLERKVKLEKILQATSYPAYLYEVQADKEMEFNIDMGTYYKRIQPIEESLKSRDFDKALKNVNNLIKNSTGNMLTAVKIYKAYLCSQMGKDRLMECKSTLFEVQDSLHRNLDLMNTAIDIMISIGTYEQISEIMAKAIVSNEKNLDLKERYFFSFYYARGFEKQFRIAMELYNKSKTRDYKYALWALQSILLSHKVSKSKADLKLLEIGNLLFLKIQKSFPKTYNNILLIYNFYYEKGDFIICINILNDNREIFPNEDEFIVLKMYAYSEYYNNKHNYIYTITDTQSDNDKTVGFYSAINVLFQYVRRKKFFYHKMNGYLFSSLNDMCMSYIKKNLVSLNNLNLEPILFSKHMFDSDVYVNNPYLDKKLQQTHFKDVKDMPQYVAQSDDFITAMGRIHAMYNFLLKFKPVDSHINTYLERIEYPNKEVLFDIHARIEYRDNSIYEANNKNIYIGYLQWIHLLLHFSINPCQKEPNLYTEFMNSYIAKYSNKFNAIDDIRTFMEYTSTANLIKDYELLISEEKDDLKFTMYSVSQLKLYYYEDYISAFYFNRADSEYLIEKISSVLKLIYDREGILSDGMDNVLHFLCYLIFYYERHYVNNTNGILKDPSYNYYDTIVATSYLLYNVLYNERASNNLFVRMNICEILSSYGYYYMSNSLFFDTNKLNNLQVVNFGWYSIFLNKYNSNYSSSLSQLTDYYKSFINSIKYYNPKEMQAMYNNGGYTQVEEMYKYKQMIVEDYFVYVLDIKNLDVVLLESIKYEGSITKSYQLVKQLKGNMEVFEYGYNLYVNDDISHMTYIKHSSFTSTNKSIFLSYMGSNTCWECVGHRHSDHVLNSLISLYLAELPTSIQEKFKVKLGHRSKWIDIPKNYFRYCVYLKYLIKWRPLVTRLVQYVTLTNAYNLEVTCKEIREELDVMQTYHSTYCIKKVVEDYDHLKLPPTTATDFYVHNCIPKELILQNMWSSTLNIVSLLIKAIHTKKACIDENPDKAHFFETGVGFNHIKRAFFFLDMKMESQFLDVQKFLESQLSSFDFNLLVYFLYEYSINVLNVVKYCFYSMNQIFTETKTPIKDSLLHENLVVGSGRLAKEIMLDIDFSGESLKECKKLLKKFIADYKGCLEKYVVDVLKKYTEQEEWMEALENVNNWVTKNSYVQTAGWMDYIRKLEKTEKEHLLHWVDLISSHCTYLSNIKIIVG